MNEIFIVVFDSDKYEIKSGTLEGMSSKTDRAIKEGGCVKTGDGDYWIVDKSHMFETREEAEVLLSKLNE